MQLPTAHLDRHILDTDVGVPAAQLFAVVDAHHVRVFLTVAEFKDAEPFTVNGYCLVRELDGRLDEIGYERLVRGVAGKIVPCHRFQPLHALFI